MASSKRNFSDFANFPGEVNTKGIYKFPTVKSIDSLQRNREWTIYVRLVKDAKKHKLNWEINQDNTIYITDDMINGEDLPGLIAQIWTEQGIVSRIGDTGIVSRTGEEQKYKLTRSVPSYIRKGKNIGKSNETTVLTQALINARSKYLKKFESNTIRTNNKRYFPVAVHKYDYKSSKSEKNISYPAAVQRKLDGGRAVAYYEDGKVVFYTRKLKDIPQQQHIKSALEKFYKLAIEFTDKFKDAYIDGEIYKHGLTLQDISGIMRREKSNKKTDNKKTDTSEIKNDELEYHVFDVFFPNDADITFMERLILLEGAFKYVKKKNPKLLNYIKLVKTYIAKTKKEETLLYNKFLAEKYEGSIVRNLDSPYEFSSNKEIRSYQARKRKPRPTAEFEIVDFIEGTQGKAVGTLVWIVMTKEGRRVRAPPNMKQEESAELFKSMTPQVFKKKYKGKMMTVAFNIKTKDGIPSCPRALGVRYFD
jgi:ATP-dependent DNA ligase